MQHKIQMSWRTDVKMSSLDQVLATNVRWNDSGDNISWPPLSHTHSYSPDFSAIPSAIVLGEE